MMPAIDYLRQVRKYINCFLILSLFFPASVLAQDSVFKIYLVGDAGEDAQTGETLKNLGKELSGNPNSAVIFLGDNCYKSDLWGIIPYGFKGFDSSKLTQEKVRSQLNILNDYKGYTYFVPGNHDWWNLTDYDKGKGKLKMEESFIESNLSQNKSIANPDQTFLPKNGEPGPDWVDLNNHTIRIIFIDSYRLIIDAFKKSEQLESAMEKKFYVALDSIIAEGVRHNEKVIVTAHHPVYAKGPNSSKLKSPNLFGRIKASNSSFPANNKMAAKIRGILIQYPGIYYACGHIHSLQYYYPPEKIHYIISGAGSKTSYVSEKEEPKLQPTNNTDFALWNIKGFFEIDFGGDGDKIFCYYDNGTKKCEIE
ncbi:MAG TPA: metallophosphoesterase [Puia sp.]|nr:metallophosphoesterase [Puia sp.]